jgi:nitrite reductase (NADH) large subunit
VVVHDADGIAAALDAAIEAAAKAVRDPWKEREQPKTVNQFSTLVEARD